MTPIEEIKAKYPNIDINLDGGSDSFQPDAPIVERDPIAVVIKHPTENKYLLAQWKTSIWTGFLTGGIEDGDTLEQTVQKEIQEETGYASIDTIQPLDCVSHGLFFHTVKDVNRLAHYHLVYAQLANLEQQEVDEKEKAIAEFVWIEKDKIEDLLTREDMKILWRYYLEHSMIN